MPSRRQLLLGGAATLAATTTGIGLGAAPAAAAPTALTASDFRLAASGVSGLLDDLDALLPVVSVGDVVDSANRTGAAASPHASNLSAAFTWQSGDNTVTYWIPQGITSSADAYAAGTYDGKTVLLASWYYDDTGVDKGVRVSFVDYSTPSAPTYRHVLLVEPYTDSAGHPNFKPIAVHAGGLCWYGYYLYVPDTWNGFRVFDMRHIWQVTTGDSSAIGRQSDGTYQAFDYLYVLPQAMHYTSSTVNGAAALRYSCVSLDRSSVPDSLIVAEYNVDGDDTSGAGTRVVRFPIDYTTRMLTASSDGYVHGSEAYRVFVPSVQGGACVSGKFYLSASNGSSGYGSLWTFTASSGPTKYASAMPIGNEDLSYWPAKDQLWTLTEYAGIRYVLSVTASAF